MVGLYKDPDGKKITFLSSVGNRSIGAETNDQVKQLQRKVSELESSLRKYVSVSSVIIKESKNIYIKILKDVGMTVPKSRETSAVVYAVTQAEYMYAARQHATIITCVTP